MKKQNPHIKIFSQSGGNLANLIELNDKVKMLTEINSVVAGLLSKNDLIDTVILGCTHYALIEKEIAQILPKHIRVVGQGELVATKLKSYLAKHVEFSNKLSDSFSLNFNTTSDSKHVQQLMTYFYGEKISISIVNI